MPNYRTLFTDAFNESNGALDTVSSGNWLKNVFGLQILSQQCVVSLASTTCVEQLTAVSLTTDQWASCQIAAWNSNDPANTFYLSVRANNVPHGGGNQGYLLQVQQGNGFVTTLLFNNLNQVVGSLPQPSVSANDVFLLQAVGTGISVYKNSILQGSVSDSTASSGGPWLSLVSGNTSDAALVNFAAGDFGPVTEDVVNNIDAVPVQIFGRVSSGPNAGQIAAVACDANGNLAVSGGS